ncbi:unnamed product [Ostreococcus tauri]|uniref:Unnamed product n=1 Tax=Ostreococcus tauri TaxID=70448 RepID=Q00SW5_OSTTA|nr:unnamed product [Ostreococcus tauri]OUS45211.1 hypothetical protein BE221DRAFT_193413 [Ostreococcus tauri]CAL58499.1 unnamed product [Ostreococcus tauri]|eukprot:XP_003084083.1 unnamed product [Ostreococcus tauri]
MRRSESLGSIHVENAMSSVKSLQKRGLDLPNTGRWFRRKHRTMMCCGILCVVLVALWVIRWRNGAARREMDELGRELAREAKKAVGRGRA